MDPASVITLCKENIQPLRHGRNATQLGTALRAQEDTEAQQILLQEKQTYEDAIKNYEGDDPLEVWYEYILWVEQSYPKSGHESHIGKLLQQCLAAFEKETKYHQDRRYIRLWINYISMQKNPLELYQLLANNGIGTMVADMYRAWAFELEQVNDNKKADEVYSLGIRAGAEPREELAHAHQNFQIAVARRTLGRMEERNELALLEQRQAFSSLRAIKSGKRATIVRTGNRVRDYQPGVVAQSSQVPRQNAKIQIYQDEPESLEPRGSSILDHVPIEDTVHKENTIKAGPWNRDSRKHQLIPSSVRPSFKIHEDKFDDDFDKIDPMRPLDQVYLYPNHCTFFDGSNYPEHMTVPVLIPDRTTAPTKTYYPKDLVYANNEDKSMEEIRAERLFRTKKMQQKINEIGSPENVTGYQGNMTGFQENINVPLPYCSPIRENNEEQGDFESREKERIEAKQRKMERRRAEQFELERQRREELQKQEELEEQRREDLERQRREEIERQKGEELERQRREELERQRREEMERQRCEELKRQRREELERQRQEEMDRQRIEAERIEAERIEAQRMEQELSRQRKMQTSNYMQVSANSSMEPSIHDILGQSITVNTKEAMSVVQDLWHSPNESASQMPSTPIHRIPVSREKFSFDIHMDSSMTQQHAMSSSKHHTSFGMQPYHDQENQHYVGYQGHQQYRHSMQDAYGYPVQQHQMPQQMQQHHLSPHVMQSPHMHHQVQHQQQQQQHYSPHIPQSPSMGHHHHAPHNIHNIPQSPMQQQQQLQQQHLQSPSMHHMYNSPNMHQANMRYSNIQQHHQQPQQHAQPPHIQQHIQQNHHQPHHHIQQAPTHHPQSSHVQQPPQLQHQQQPQLPHQQQQQQQQHLQQNLHHPHQQHHSSPQQHHQIPHQPQIPQQPQYPLMEPPQFQPYIDPALDSSKSYRMPELPYIKSPGMNRRDLKYSTDNKENSSTAEGFTLDGNKHNPNLSIDESLGIAPLVNETCFTDGFAGPLTSSTPMTNQFRPPTNRARELPPPVPQFPVQQQQQQQLSEEHPEPDEKLSVIMESTREYISSSSGSSIRTGNFGGTMGTIPEASTQEIDTTEALLENQRDQSILRAKLQAVHAQSPRTMQRNVDQITSDINQCDLRIPLKLDAEAVKKPEETPAETVEKAPESTMECQFNEPMEEVEEEEFVLPTGDFNPFDKTIVHGLLRNLKFPQPQHSEGYHRLNMNLNKLQASSHITLGPDTYDLEKCLGKGTYGTVMKATNVQTGQSVALKCQRPAWVWEYYIAREIKARITNPHMLRGFMDCSHCYVVNNASLLVSEFSKYGTLLGVTNQVKIATGKPLIEPLAIYFTIEMLQIVEYLHKCQIIHGDIKPDNFLLMHVPTEDVRPTIQLIDFGCSIDMSLFPEGTKFTQIIKTEDFTCIEMQTGRPWTYQTDLYCLAASAHCLLFGNYMRVTHTGDKWFITTKMPRYVKKEAWEPFFTELLNIESCDKMPDLVSLRNTLEEALGDRSSLDSKFRNFANVLNKR